MSVSKAPAFKSALFSACQTLFGSLTTVTGDYNVLVSYGWPTSWSDEFVILGDVTSDQEVATMGSNRSRWETLNLSGRISVYVGGADQQTTTERAYYLLGLLETYLQDAGNIPSSQITLGGSVVQSRVMSHELSEPADDDDVTSGRTTDLFFTVYALARI